ncbi:beta-glucosidase [Bryobacterales bacterium F-183]|nr:beta-glucosidase [Bryobacterales bacterium F-183]
MACQGKPTLQASELFFSFWQAGFECSTHKLRSGKRLDLVHSTRHDELVDLDYARLRPLGIRTVREGLRWHRIEATPHEFDFSTVVPFLEAAERYGIQIVWDLMHFGWPDHIDVFETRFPYALEELAHHFASFLEARGIQDCIIAPVNEISFTAWAAGETGYMNPFALNRGSELKRRLATAAIRASKAVRAILPNARLLAPEPVIHIRPLSFLSQDAVAAEQARVAMYEAWDMLAGRLAPELGGAPELLDILGVNYYDRNQWWHKGETIRYHEPQYRPFSDILQEIHARYSRPIVISETGTEGDERAPWLAYIAGQVRHAIAAGVPVEGICLYPILNHPGWDDDRHCPNGLWDYAGPDDDRAIYQPLADEIIRNRDLLKDQYELPALQTTRSYLPFAPSLELRVSTASALDEPLCTQPAGVFF